MNIDDRITKLQKQTEKLIREKAAVEAFLAQFENGLPDARLFWLENRTVEWWLTYGSGHGGLETPYNLASVLALMELHPPLPIGLGKGTSTKFGPDLSENLKDYPNIQSVAPFILTVNEGEGFGTLKVEWWSVQRGTPTYKVSVEMPINSQQAITVLWKYNEASGRRWPGTGRVNVYLKGYKTIHWYADARSIHQTIYWPEPSTKWEDIFYGPNERP